MPVADTSTAHYHSSELQPVKIDQRIEVLRVIEDSDHPLTIKEISRQTGIADGSVSARLDELRRANLVEVLVDGAGNEIKRPCTVNGIKKIQWVPVRKPFQSGLWEVKA